MGGLHRLGRVSIAISPLAEPSSLVIRGTSESKGKSKRGRAGRPTERSRIGAGLMPASGARNMEMGMEMKMKMQIEMKAIKPICLELKGTSMVDKMWFVEDGATNA
jgi:hypothetical protein